MPNPRIKPEPSYLTAQDAATILHVSPKTITRWAKEGRLAYAMTLGGHRRFKESDIRALAESLRFEATEQP